MRISTLLRVFWSAVIVALLLASLPLAGQERFGGVTGTVKDPSGALIPDASVKITNTETNRVRTTKTRADGTFTVLDIDPGRYTVMVEKEGFSRFEGGNVLVLIGRNANIEATMKVGSATETVEVSAAAQMIDTSSTMVAHNVTVEELDRLPKGRNFEAVAVLSPSVNTGFIDGGYQINGASGAENNYYVDGVSTNSVIDGSARQSATFDYLQEVQVKTTGLEAEYGGAMGGVVTAVTKSGGNQFHGDVHYYYYGNLLNAAPTKRLAIDNSQPTIGSVAGGSTFNGPYTTAFIQDNKYQRDNHEFGGSFGGPIMKDKLWFFTSASPRWLRQSANYQFTDGPGTMNRAGNQINWFSKLSYNPTERIRTNFSYLYTPSYQTGSMYANVGLGADASNRSKATAASDGLLGYFQAENSVTGQVDFTLSNTSLLSVKGGRYFLDYKDTGVTAQTQWEWGASTAGRTDLPAQLRQPDGYVTPSAAQTSHDLTTRTYIQADFSQMLKAFGQHNLKFGMGTTKNVNNVLDSSAPNGIVTLYWGQTCSDCASSGSTDLTGAYGYYSVDKLGTIGTTGSNITHLYLQDSWKITSRLVINPGVRFEKETIPSFRPDIQKYAIQFGWAQKVAPRLGASFDLLGNGKVKISGGWGRFYDWTKYDLARGTFGADFWWTYYRSLDDPNQVFSLGLDNMPGRNLFNSDHKDWRIPAFDTLDPNVKPMSVDNLNAGIEWEVLKDTVFTGRYVRSKLNRTIEDMGVLINGSEAYRYGNPGEGTNVFEPASGASCPVTVDGTCAVPMPKAKRLYDAMELSLSRRFGQGWLGNISYVYSRLWGNYSGLQSTDEIRSSTTGRSYAPNQGFAGQSYRPGGNANRYFDLDEAFYDANGNNGLFGLLPTDRPHVLKIYGAKQFKFGTEIGTFFRVQSGTPVTTQVYSTNNIPIYVNGRGDMGRTPVFSQTDLVVAHEFKIGKSETKRLRLEFNATNLFNQKTAVYTYSVYNRYDHVTSTGLKTRTIDLTRGFDFRALTASSGLSGLADLDPRYGQASDFNPGFQGRFLVKYTF